jgi:hypothetical protein
VTRNLSPRAASATVDIWVQPGASRQRVVGMYGDAVKVAVAAPAEKGAANRALKKLLAEEFGLASGAVTVIAGGLSRRKRVSLQGVSPDRVRAWVARWKTER